MRIVIAPDSFKECLSAAEVCGAVETGLRRAFPEAELVSVPMADGGEGTVDALMASTSGVIVTERVKGPLGEPVDARYGVTGDGGTAVIEMAEAAGLHLVPEDRRNPGVATTFGLGQLMVLALARGVGRMVVGLGGSATNDGGAGMAQALGYSLRDGEGRELAPGGLALASLETIAVAPGRGAWEGVDVMAACDVDNPLCGEEGASRVYGPQKGAGPGLVGKLDEALRHYGKVVRRELGIEVADVPGAGAAGGLGAGLLAFVGGRLRPGVEVVAEACGLAARMEGADLVITGEGRLDGQSARGKTPVGVARLAKERGIPVVVLAGALGEGYEAVYEAGVDVALGIAPKGLATAEAMGRAAEFLAGAAERFARNWRVGEGIVPSEVE